MALMMQARPDSNPGAFGLRWNDANGLTIPINGGAVLNGTVWTLVPRASIQLANNDTTYVEVNPGGNVQWQTGQFTSGLGYVSLYTIRVASNVVTSITDWRFGQTNVNGNTAPTFTSRKTLTDAQIRALPSTPITLVEAQGVGKVIVPIAAAGILDHTAGAYTVDDGSSWLLMYEGGTYVGDPVPVDGGGGTMSLDLDPAVPFYIPLPVTAHGFYSAAGPFSNVITGDNTLIGSSSSANKALQIKDDWNGVSDYTGGNAANTLTVTVLYTLFDTTLA